MELGCKPTRRDRSGLLCRKCMSRLLGQLYLWIHLEKCLRLNGKLSESVIWVARVFVSSPEPAQARHRPDPFHLLNLVLVRHGQFLGEGYLVMRDQAQGRSARLVPANEQYPIKREDQSQYAQRCRHAGRRKKAAPLVAKCVFENQPEGVAHAAFLVIVPPQYSMGKTRVRCELVRDCKGR